MKFSLLVTLLSLMTVAVANAYGLGLPTANLEVEDLVPFETAREIAQKKAETAWGQVTLGPAIPYCDLDGKIRAYSFGVSRGWAGFPNYQAIVNEVEEARRLGAQDQRWGVGEYGSIVVSARFSEVPVPEMSDCLPRYYTTGHLAKERAEELLGSSEVHLSKIYYGSPLDLIFEFSAGERRVLIDAFSLGTHSLDILGSERKTEEDPVLEDQIASLWREIESPLARDTVLIPGVPAFLWSYGCTPTASAMLFGYWDLTDYGKLLDYYFHHDDYVVGPVANVPNVQRELALAMHTDTLSGGTQIGWISYGHVYVANTVHNYAFSSQTSPEGGVGNDFNWAWVTQEADAGRPFHWCVIRYWYGGQYIPHSLAGLGYTTDKYVIVHNTWDHGTHYWYYYTYHGGVYSEIWVVTLVPGGGNPNNVALTRPVGMEHFLSGLKGLITWSSVGGGIDHIGLEYSLDNTRTWQTMTTSTPNIGSYIWWVPVASSDSVRVKVEAYTGGNALLAADGSSDGLFVFRVTDALNVYAVGYSDARGDATNLFVASDLAYLAGGISGLIIFDISDPTLPIQVGRYDTADQAYSVWVVDTLAYVADVGDGLRIINCSDPTNPMEIGSLDTPDKAYGVHVSGSHAYVADRTSGLRVINVSDPTTPSEDGFCDTPGLAWDVRVVGDYAYVADVIDGLVVINVADSSNPQIEGSCDTPGRAYGVYVVDTLAYVADYDHGVQVISVSDPSSPYIVDSHDTDGYAWKLWVHDGYVYVADGSDGLRVLRPDLTEIGHYNTYSDAKGVFVFEPNIWVADGGDGIYVLTAPPFGVEESQEASSKKQEARLHQNRPNPFTRTTEVRYQIPDTRHATLAIYDLSGRLVRTLVDGGREPGTYTAIWDGRDSEDREVPNGVYFYRLTAGELNSSRKLLVLR